MIARNAKGDPRCSIVDLRSYSVRMTEQPHRSWNEAIGLWMEWNGTAWVVMENQPPPPPGSPASQQVQRSAKANQQAVGCLALFVIVAVAIGGVWLFSALGKGGPSASSDPNRDYCTDSAVTVSTLGTVMSGYVSGTVSSVELAQSINTATVDLDKYLPLVTEQSLARDAQLLITTLKELNVALVDGGDVDAVALEAKTYLNDLQAACAAL